MALLNITKKLNQAAHIDDRLTLSYEQRQKSRQRVCLDSGIQAGLILPRGNILRGGDILQADNDLIIEIHAAKESITTAHTNDPLLLARGAYHLGNRHIALQIDKTCLRYLVDHVLDEMIISLGFKINHEMAPFEPQAGAYDDHPDQSHRHISHG